MTSFREEGHPGCPACKTVEVGEVWRALELVATMNGSDLFPSSAAWAERVIEVRECPQCGRSIARTRGKSFNGQGSTSLARERSMDGPFCLTTTREGAFLEVHGPVPPDREHRG